MSGHERQQLESDSCPTPPVAVLSNHSSSSSIRSSDNTVHWSLNAIGGKPLVVALVGLPGRGKTIISTKLQRVLTWNKISCSIYHLSNYRRLIAPHYSEHELDKPLKICEVELRDVCMKMLFKDLDNLFSDFKKNIPQITQQCDIRRGDVAIFDAANTLRSQREELIDFCKEREYDLFFIETLTYDLNLIQLYICGIEQSHPDYLNLSRDEAVIKFESHFEDYAKTYETLDAEKEKNLSFIKIFDGGSRCLVHNMAGFLQSKLVYYLMNLHFARQPIYITRHGESLNNTLGIIGGDTELTSRGLQYADAFADYINSLPEIRNRDNYEHPVQVWTSVLKRAQQTASRVHAPVLCWNALTEIDAGQFDGKSYDYIKENYPDEFQRRQEDKFRYRYPEGESYDDLVARLEPVIMELERTRSTIVIVCHQAVMRCLMAYLLNKDFNELPFLDVPLHHLLKVTPAACSYEVEAIDFDIPASDYIRSRQKKNSSISMVAK